jgi:hypothetical protein
MSVRLEPIMAAALATLLAGCSSEAGGTVGPGTTSGTGSTTTDLELDASTEDGGDGGDVPCVDQDFPLTETQVDLLVPLNARYMQIKAWGAGGNGEGQCAPPDDDAGLGGFSGANFQVSNDANAAVQPGSHLVVIVGQRGRAGLGDEDVVRFGFGHWGGGGLSGVFHGPELITATDQAKAILVAGGGGGASAPGCMFAGTGNHPDAGGMTGTMMGGAGTDEVNGGGGGYEGGLGGGHIEPGMGGTGFIHAAAEPGFLQDHADPGSGVAPRSEDADYADNAGTDEQPGRVVIRFTCDAPPPI